MLLKDIKINWRDVVDAANADTQSVPRHMRQAVEAINMVSQESDIDFYDSFKFDFTDMFVDTKRDKDREFLSQLARMGMLNSELEIRYWHVFAEYFTHY